MAKNLGELCSSVLWKVKIVSNEIGCLAEDILSKVLKEWHGFPLPLIKNVRRER